MPQEGGEVSKDEILNALSSGYPKAEPKEKLKGILQEILENNENIESTIVASTEGLPVAWVSKKGAEMQEEGKIAAAVSVIFLTSERNSMDLDKGHVGNIIVKGTRGYVVLRLVGEDHVLASVTSEKSRPSVVIRDMTSVSEKIGKVLAKF